MNSALRTCGYGRRLRHLPIISSAKAQLELGPMIVAYADPPYIGQAAKHYAGQPDYAGEVDHGELIERLCAEYHDDWALHTASTTLKQVLSLCPDDVRVGAWVKPFGVMKPGVNPGYLWEPVIFRGGRRRTDRQEETVRDWCSVPIALQRGLVGA